MHRVFRLRHLLILAAVLAVGLLPVYAFRSLGTPDSFAVLANTVVSTGATVDVDGNPTLGAGFGDADLGANTFTPSPTNITTDGAVVTGVGAQLTELSTVAADLFAEAGTFGTNITSGAVTNLATVNVGSGAGVLTPGVYIIDQAATLGAGDTLTLSGAGDYLIEVDANLTINGTIALAGGASAANVIFGSGTTTIGTNAIVRGKVIGAAGDITVANGANIVGKLLSVGTITFANGATVNIDDAGSTPTLALTGVSGEAPDANVGDVDPSDEGTAADPLVVTEGDVLNFSITSTDPDGGPVTITRTGANPAGLTATNSAAGTPTATLDQTFAPPLNGPQSGQTVELIYTTTETNTGAINSRSVFIFINQLPEASGPTNISGAAPVSGTGAPGDPIVVCSLDTLEFDYTGSDPDLDGGPTTLSVTGDAGVANLTFTPALPLTEGDDDVTTTVTFSPDATQGGDTVSLTFTTTDDNGETVTETVEIFVSSLPTFAAPFTEPGLDVVTACVGDLVQYDISASDPDTGDAVSISVDGTPVGASHDPNFLGVDNGGPFGDDLLVIPGLPTDPSQGNPSTTRFQWVPTPGDEGAYLLTYTAEDSFGCLQSTTVVLFVTNEPTVTATATATAPSPGSPDDFGTVTDGEVLTVCPGGTLTVPVTAADPDGDNVTLSAAGIPGNATFTPGLPITGASPVNSTLTFTPTAAQSGQTFNVTLTAVDATNAPTVTDPSVVQCDVTETLSFTIQVANAPVFTITGLAGTTVEAGNVINTCVGEPISFRVRATDVDPGNVTLSATGAPAGSLFTPGLPSAGNPVESDFTFNPTAAAAPTSVITFTATDADGCATTTTVTINVSQNPVITISGITGQPALGAGTGTTAADPLVVCAPGTSAAGTLSFTVSASDPDAANVVTLSQVGAPGNATFVQGLPAAGNPVSSVFSFTPTAAQAGQTFSLTFTAVDNSAAACTDTETVFIRVAAAPVITTTASTINTCEGADLNFRIRATDTDDEDVTIGVPTITAPAGAPALTLVTTPSLPLTDNPVETVVTGVAPEVTVDTTYTVTYTATDEDGCASSVVVTINVSNTEATTVTLTRTGSLAVGSQVCYTALVLDNCPAAAGGPQPVAGVPVCFTVNGTTGNNQQVTLVTGADGTTPPFCFTPVFPGTDTVTAVIDFNGDCIADAGTTGATETVTIGIPGTDAGTSITGQGYVDASGLLGGPIPGAPVAGQFNIDFKVKRNGAPAGRFNFVVPRVGRTGIFKAQSTSVTSLDAFETASGRSAIVFGTAKTSEFGTVPFRLDLSDNGTPGVPNDRFVVTFLLPSGDLVVGGGSLGFTRNSKGARVSDDIKIRFGTSRPGQN
jgi:hypothetical protein